MHSKLKSETFVLKESLPSNKTCITNIGWSKDGAFLALSGDNYIWLWDVDRRKLSAPLETDSKVNVIAWSNVGQMIAFSTEKGNKIQIRDLGNKTLSLVLEREMQQINNLAWSPNCKYLVCTSSFNGIILFLERSTGYLIKQTIDASIPFISRIVWASNGLLACSVDTKIFLWNASENTLNEKKAIDNQPGILKGHSSIILALAWTSDGQYLSSGSIDCTIKIWDSNTYQCVATLEGHTERITSLSFSFDNHLLSSIAKDGIRIWNTENWQLIAEQKFSYKSIGLSLFPFQNPALKNSNTPKSLAFHPQQNILAATSENCKDLRTWNINFDKLFSSKEINVVNHISSKIVLVGESNVGKSCLAMRLAKDRYPTESEQGTTHSMRIWQIDPEQLNASTPSPVNQRREIILWDLGGQIEYRLIHLLFLHDTSLALIFFDPSRGKKAIEEVEVWNKQLDKQLSGRDAIKLLIGSKIDEPSPITDRKMVDDLVRHCGFEGYYETSALTGRGIPELKLVISQCLNWDALPKTTRPELFQYIREEVNYQQKKGEIVLPLEKLEATIKEKYPELFEPAAVSSVTHQLSLQGVIATTKSSSGKNMLILKVEEIQQYAGALILSARNNIHGVPAIEVRTLGLRGLLLPGIEEKDRLSQEQEKIILECVAELLIQHGICFRHEGLLIFPTLFHESKFESDLQLSHSISLYYRFSGAIDNIYASLVAQLVLSREFGEYRLWANRIEFDEHGKGVCGIRQVKQKGGIAQIDLFFSEKTLKERRNFFIYFVENHLKKCDVELIEHQVIKCRECGYEISEDIVQANIMANKDDVICPKCRTHTLISDGVEKIRKHDKEADKKIIALRTMIEKRTEEQSNQAKIDISINMDQPTSSPIRILHLSDLHFTVQTSPAPTVQWLIDDLQKGLKIENLDYVVISGDFIDKGKEDGYVKCKEFVSLLISKFNLSSQRCIFVPGNHDIVDQKHFYDWRDNAVGIQPGTWIQKEDIILVRNEEKYIKRLESFSKFFHEIRQKPYSLEYEEQGIAYLFEDTYIQFLTLNSCWQIDQFHRKRAGVHPDAIAQVIKEADKQVEDMIVRNQWKKNMKVLRFAVWHHAIVGTDMMNEIDFLENLQNNNVKVCLHGDVHEMRRESIKSWHRNQMHVLGAGSFGSSAEGRPESTPRLYNLLEIDRDLKRIRVHTRCQPKFNGAWKGWNEWPRPDGGDGGIPYFFIDL